MNDSAPDIQAKMKALQDAYLASLAERRGEITSALVALKVDGDSRAIKAALEEIRHHAHKTAGSGATFGFSDISTTAKALELACEDLLDAGQFDEIGAVNALTPLTNELLAAIDAAGGAASAPFLGEGMPSPKTKAANANRTVLLVSAEDKSSIDTGLANFGFQIQRATTLDEAQEKWGKEQGGNGDSPVAAVVDQGAGLSVGSENLAEAFGCPVIFLLEHDQLQDRLMAVRAGADACFIKPVRVVELVDAVDRLALDNEAEPYRVLVVDDDKSVSHYNVAVLESAGMIAHAVTDATNIMKVLDDFSPEMILMDLYMPDCDGQELSSVIRQKEEFAGIPIVFLSSETDVHKQVAAMSHGGDGFLTKPITPRHLTEYIQVRAKRFRMLRNLMVRDSLTGLYNHTTTQQLLDNEIARAERDGAALSFAMVDIDHFKSVNDTHGHGVGDQVIKSLSRLLKQRLRTTDIVGRMGGEEFGVILPGATGDVAVGIIDAIRIAFSEIDQPGADDPFHTTFSCGVAEAEKGTVGAALSEAADKALYGAKEGGRNRVVLADG